MSQTQNNCTLKVISVMISYTVSFLDFSGVCRGSEKENQVSKFTWGHAQDSANQL